jgi:hypothetical protein
MIWSSNSVSLICYGMTGQDMLYYQLVSYHITGYVVMSDHVISYDELAFNGLMKVQSVSIPSLWSGQSSAPISYWLVGWIGVGGPGCWVRSGLRGPKSSTYYE